MMDMDSAQMGKTMGKMMDMCMCDACKANMKKMDDTGMMGMMKKAGMKDDMMAKDMMMGMKDGMGMM